MIVAQRAIGFSRQGRGRTAGWGSVIERHSTDEAARSSVAGRAVCLQELSARSLWECARAKILSAPLEPGVARSRGAWPDRRTSEVAKASVTGLWHQRLPYALTESALAVRDLVVRHDLSR